MSKAFTRESDDAPDRPEPRRPVSSLPPGAKNYLTADGAKRMREELDQLANTERPRVAASGSQDETRSWLQALDQRILHLEHSLQTAVIVPPPALSEGVVRFGATVTVREAGGGETTYRIVGMDEVDLDRDWVSWLSPIAKALLNARLGQRGRFRFPAGEKELEIVGIVYGSE